VSTHPPFINPENKEKSEEKTFRYADKHIGIFYKKLMETNFFDNGVLIIVGDHHAMVPLIKKEIDMFGSYKAASKVPMIVSYGKNQSVIENSQYQQIDVFQGLRNMVSTAKCHSDWVGDIISKEPAKFIAHRRGDNRNTISIFTEDKNFLVILNGDNSQVVTSEADDKKTQKLIINKINSVRILKN